MTDPATTPPTPAPRRRRRTPCDHDPRTCTVARDVAPHLWDLAHHDDARPGSVEAFNDVLYTTALALHHGAEYDAVRPAAAPSPAEATPGEGFTADDYVELHAEFLESRQQYLAAGLLRELTVAPARAADGTLVGDPPTGALPAVGRIVPFRR